MAFQSIVEWVAHGLEAIGIATVAAVPTPTRLLMLTGIILLRTFLSTTLMLEVEGRWPWGVARRDACALPFSAQSQGE